MYCKARMMRAGLGNRLLPWARCRIFAHVNQARMLQPLWVNPMLGPLLRREADFRLYHDLFRPRPGDVGRWKTLWLERTARKTPEPKHFTERYTPIDARAVVEFEGYGDYFTRMQGWEAFLLQELRTITLPQWLGEVDRMESCPIAIHVRHGDFKVPQSPEEMFTKGGVRTPLPWFVDTLRAVRAALGFNARALLISDGREAELKQLLAQENVVFAPSVNAISGILLLARSKILLGTGGSSFSAWGAFLGGMPTVVHPGQNLTWFGLRDRPESFLGVFDPKSPDTRFLDQVSRLGKDIRAKRAA